MHLASAALPPRHQRSSCARVQHGIAPNRQPVCTWEIGLRANSALPAAWAWRASLEAPGAPVSWPGKVKALGEGQEPDAQGDGAGDGCVGVSLDRQVERQKQEDEPSRAEAIRRLVEQALKTKAK